MLKALKFIFLFFVVLITNAQNPVSGILNHSQSYFKIYPFGSSYDDGSHARIFYDGNNKTINFWNSDSNTAYTKLKVGSLFAIGNMGIGEENPQARLHIRKAGQSLTFLKGVNTSGYELNIGLNDDGVNMENSSTIRGFNFKNANGNLISISPTGDLGVGTTDFSTKISIKNRYTKFIGFERNGLDKKAHIGYGTAHNGGIYLGTDDNQYTLWVQQNGNVGIGTYNPGNWKLAVNGKIRTKEVKVEIKNWSDFVFYKNYNLPSLKDVENHIKANGHLKDIPSAKEVKENGVYLGEMDAKLLQKIEELTLYTIKQEKKIENQEKKYKEQEKKIKKLEFLINTLLKNK